MAVLVAEPVAGEHVAIRAERHPHGGAGFLLDLEGAREDLDRGGVQGQAPFWVGLGVLDDPLPGRMT